MYFDVNSFRHETMTSHAPPKNELIRDALHSTVQQSSDDDDDDEI